MTIDFFKEYLKMNKVVSYLYLKVKNSKYLQIDKMKVPRPYKSSISEPRINLVLTDLRKSCVFGGITTAIDFFLKLSDLIKIDQRILITENSGYSKKFTYNINGFEYNRNEKGIYFLGENENIDIRICDIFIFTHWTTAFAFLPVIKWQRKEYGNLTKKDIYFIQDYEPGFYPWSTEYALAESTYVSESNSIIAIFNSEELYCFFKQKGYHFANEFFFRPCLNDKLKEVLMSYKQFPVRKKRILIYGRPGTYRNAFELIRVSLQIWSKNYSKASEWEIISLGENFKDIKMENNIIHSCGKVSLSEYGNIMLTSFIGISLMISPHPSYPPLEMSVFGIKTITNSFENKDLSNFNENIVSLKYYTPDIIAKKLMEICDSYGHVESKIILEGNYINDFTFKTVIKETKIEIDKMIQESMK